MKPEIESRHQRITDDCDADLRKLITEIIRRCPKKRQAIAEELSLRLRQHITPAMLNAFTAMSNRGARFPAAWIRVFSEVVTDDGLERLVIGRCNRETLELGEIAKLVLDEAAQKGLKSLAGKRKRLAKLNSKGSARHA